jgi:hypothetical protein
VIGMPRPTTARTRPPTTTPLVFGNLLGAASDAGRQMPARMEAFDRKSMFMSNSCFERWAGAAIKLRIQTTFNRTLNGEENAH